ncbi:hypothetical protein BKA69DRAFT_645362 [Paraphysoderma sedebokerense]|nr:hypothetical protein BKA69DRAFT_645362 [Paraphysoderma sedebokerense]
MLEQPKRRKSKFENPDSSNDEEVTNGDPRDSYGGKNSLPCDQMDEEKDSRAEIVQKRRARTSEPKTKHEPTYRRRGRKPKARFQNLEDNSAERDIGVPVYSEISVTDPAVRSRNEEASTDSPDAEIPLASSNASKPSVTDLAVESRNEEDSTDSPDAEIPLVSISASEQSSTFLSIDDIKTLKKYDLPEVINLLEAFPPDFIATYERIRSKSLVAAQYMLDTRLKKHLSLSLATSSSGSNGSNLAQAALADKLSGIFSGPKDVNQTDLQADNAAIDAPPCSVPSADEGMIGSIAVDAGPANVVKTAETDGDNGILDPTRINESSVDFPPQVHRTEFEVSEDNHKTSSNSRSTNSRGQPALCIVVPRVRRRSTQSANSLVHSIDATQNVSSLSGVSSTLVSSPVSSCSSLSSVLSSTTTSPSSSPSLSDADDQSRSVSPTLVDAFTRDNSLDDDTIAQSIEGHESDPDLRIPEEYRFVLPVAQRRQPRKSAMAKKNYCVGRKSTRSSSCRI